MKPFPIADKRRRAEIARWIEAYKTGKDPKTGMTFRIMELTDKTRKRGGARSKRRTARVWEPAEIDIPELPDEPDTKVTAGEQ